MRKLTLILILIFGFDLYSQESEYKPISESDIKIHSEKNIDTINNKRLAWKWKVMKSEDKEKIRNRISEIEKDIESDSTDWTKILYYGKKENVGLKIDGKFLKPNSSSAEYYSESIYGDSIFKIDLGTIARYSKVQSAKLFFKDSKRTAEFEIDTNYSLINIKVENIRSLSEILKWEKETEKNAEEIKKSGKLPEIPDTIEIWEDDEIFVIHKIPKKSTVGNNVYKK